jgi:hypothetical protein
VDARGSTAPSRPRHCMEAVIVKYRNFDLELFEYKVTGDSEQFRVRVTSSAGDQMLGEAEQVKLSPTLRQRTRQLRDRALKKNEIVELGKDLATALFPPKVYGFLGKSLIKLDEDEGLRIRLKLGTYALSDLPWEYAFVDADFLVLDPRVSMVRYEILGQPKSTLDPVSDYPLRLMVVLANPRGSPDLDVKMERENIENALKDLGDLIRPEFPAPRVGQIQAAFIKNKTAHIFHFSGHGQFKGDMGALYGTVEGKGELLLEDPNGQEKAEPAEDVAKLVSGRGVRLAVLSACESSRRDQVNPWTGIVPALTRAGIPAVVGMQFKIYDTNAIVFGSFFYQSLAAGESIDTAVREGRLAIYLNRNSDDERDWGVPVLYLRAEEEEGVLFPNSAGDGTKRNGGATGGGTITRPPALPSRGDINPVTLRKAMVKRYAPPYSLDTVCQVAEQLLRESGINLQVNVAIAGGNTLEAQVLNLIQYFDRRGYLPYLMVALREDAPDTDW